MNDDFKYKYWQLLELYDIPRSLEYLLKNLLYLFSVSSRSSFSQVKLLLASLMDAMKMGEVLIENRRGVYNCFLSPLPGIPKMTRTGNVKSDRGELVCWDVLAFMTLLFCELIPFMLSVILDQK